MKKRLLLLIIIPFFIAGSLHSQSCPSCIGCDPTPNPPTPCDGCDNFGPDSIPAAVDPNELIPPPGVGPEGWVHKDQLLGYMATFENDPDSATAAAQRVEIRVPMSPNLDLNSFRVGDFGFGEYYVSVPLDVSAHMDTVLSGPTLGVHVTFEAGLDTMAQEAYWIFESLDTNTLMPTTDPFAGFLPLNDSTHRGEGFVLFTVLPHPASVTFDEIDMYADIIFDLNEPLRTPMVLNTIDADPPDSQVDTVIFNKDSMLYQINLSGTDLGSGLANYTIYVSIDGSDFKPHFKTVDSTAVFTRIAPLHNYEFISVARDSVGNVEPEPGDVEFSFFADYPVLEIPLQQGWNMVSSYFQPNQADMLNIAAPYNDTVIIVKDYLGNIALPSIPLNGIGDWEVSKGYQIKVTEDMTLGIQGAPITTLENPLFIEEGWQLLPYLGNRPDSIVNELAPILSEVVLVKDNAGNVLSPAFGINDIGLLQPTRSYWLKAEAPAVLFYSDNFPGAPHPQLERVPSGLGHFNLNGLNTGNNATLIIPAAALEGIAAENDEIGIFTADGLLCGAGAFTGSNLAIAIWGDDAQTQGVLDGILPGNPFSMRIWNSNTDEEKTAAFTLTEGEPDYFPNMIYVVEDIESGISNVTPPQPDIYFKYYPNPTTGKVNFSLGLPQAARVHLSIHSLDGRYARLVTQAAYAAGLHEFSEDLSGLPGGLYVIRVVSGGVSRAYKLVLGR